jgi:hypothetical protein
MKRLQRWFRQWRESWAEAAYDDLRDEVYRLHTVNLALMATASRLEARIVRLELAAKEKSA